MATQSLYRRYRPRRFGELRGQEHVVRALRNAVINGREGQAYLFSGPRGTGKTTSARILAKVLNCERPVDGEPCCECDSCLAVERGTSFDVHELDAASNNGVDAMRDLIEKAALGTPGRHRVYILDEVHMLSKAAEAALLKTLEEPPAHVVFVLATTDPQKVSDTIRSRTQHLQFHLLDSDVLAEHIRWLAGDAGIDLGDEALQQVLRQGGGSARDTISALELVAAGGGIEADAVPLDEFVEALIEHDPGRALSAVAHSVQLGHDPRALTEDVIRHLRDCFLSLMAPELVQLSGTREEEVHDLARRSGAPTLVRALERLGEMLVEMRHAPDPRVLLEVALVQLTHDPAANSVGALADRIDRLEQRLATLASTPPAMVPTAVPTAVPAPAPSPEVSGTAADGRAVLGQRARRAATTLAAAPSAEAPQEPAGAARTDEPASGPAGEPPGEPPATGDVASRWKTEVLPRLKAAARAMYTPLTVVGVRDGRLVLAAPDDSTRNRVGLRRDEVQSVVAEVLGKGLTVDVIVDGAPSAEPTAVSDLPADEDVDLDDLVDAPPGTVVSPIDRLHAAFPGSVERDER